ncbi:hypothetical protein ACLQ28_00425 [Micromonospora sp. DT201]
MPTRKLGRLLGSTLMLLALFVGVGAIAAVPTSGTVQTLEFEWN